MNLNLLHLHSTEHSNFTVRSFRNIRYDYSCYMFTEDGLSSVSGLLYELIEPSTYVVAVFNFPSSNARPTLHTYL